MKDTRQQDLDLDGLVPDMENEFAGKPRSLLSRIAALENLVLELAEQSEATGPMDRARVLSRLAVVYYESGRGAVDTGWHDNHSRQESGTSGSGPTVRKESGKEEDNGS